MLGALGGYPAMTGLRYLPLTGGTLAGDLDINGALETGAANANGGGFVTTSEALISTADAAPVNAKLIALAEGQAVAIEAVCMALLSDGTAGVAFRARGAVRRQAGGAAVGVGSGARETIGQDAALAGCDLSVDVTGNSARVTVQGLAATSIKWRVHVRYQMLSL